MKKSKNSTIKRILTLVGISFLFHINIISQTNCDYKPPRQAENWVFGNSALINFTDGDANASAIPSNFEYPNGTSAISDINGNLKLYSNGMIVKNGGFYTITNGTGLNGNSSASQSSIIIPQPGNSTKYYIFTVDMYIPPVFTDGINYSIAELPVSGGSSISSKNNILLNENAQKITATKHSNGRDFWIVAHGFGDDKGNKFFSYLLNDSILSTTPVITSIGHPHNGTINSNNGAGSMKISPDGSKLALVIPDDGVVEIYDFNNSSGKVSNLKSSAPGQFTYANGIEFSPDNSKLYFTISPIGNGTNYLYQLDLTQTDPFANPFVVHQFDVLGGTSDSLLGALQLATDGKIYVAKYKIGANVKPNLGVVYNPNRPQSACNYNQLDHAANNGLFLEGGYSLIGLPNFASSFLDIPHFYYINKCYKDTTKITIRNKANIDFADWDFGNPAGNQVIMDNFKPGFIYSDPGDYTINLTENYGAEQYVYSKDIRINALPNIILADGVDTLFILENSSVQLDAGEWDFYEWSPGGSTERYFDVTDEGLYSVMVTDSNCCKNTDSVYVKYAKISFPTAFNPKSNVISNTEFKIVGEFGGFKSFKLSIFNRWGQLLFETDDPSNGWDGTYKGQESPVGTYVYSAIFESYETSVQSSIVVKKRGTITLLR
jgi:gliding motility-associated-like protein